MKHFGDITKISGYDVPIVDVITGGSPCQDLSVAGKRAGLQGERSGLFMEQMRIVKEMRERDVRDNGRSGWAVRPRYMVWENVPGAFSSGNPKGSDFAAVIEEIIKVAEPGACVSVCVPDGGWTKSGCYYAADGSWSIAWRVHDAQFWGVPQRRKRIALVADFGGLSAPEVLFERKGLSGDPQPGRTPWQGAAERTGGGSDPAICLQGNGIDRADTAGCNGSGWRRGGSYTLNTIDRPAVMAFKQGQGANAGSIGAQEEMSPTLNAAESGTQLAPAVCYGISSYSSNAMLSENPHSGIYEAETSRTLDLNGGSPACNQGGVAVVAAVDCRNGTENEWINGTLQSKPDGGTSVNLQNIVRVSSS